MNNDTSVQVPVTPTEKKHSFKDDILETIRFIIIALIIVIPIRVYIAQPFIVSGASMNPTFETKQYLIVDEISYHVGDPVRGDVVIFKYPKNPKQYFIKRTIGLPGETVIVDENGLVTIKNIDGTTFILDEPYVKYSKGDNVELTLGPDEYFMMGDNRAGSFDSRSWGPVSRDLIIGRAFLRLFPFSETSVFPGEFKQK
ncbi:MAG: signal peptidase I [Patescibacteria group bacterium]